jgi:hypothetical protein
VKKLLLFSFHNLILHGVLFGSETWYLTLRKEHKLKKIYGTKRDEITDCDTVIVRLTVPCLF